MSTSNLKKHVDLPLPVGITSGSLRALLGISPDALLIVDQAGILLLLNEQAEALFGYAHDELVGQPLDVLLPEHFHHVHNAHLTQYFSAPTPRPMDSGLVLLGRRKDDSQFPVDISLIPVLLDETRCAIAAVRDLTAAQHSIETQLIAYRVIEQHLSSLNLILSATTEAVYLFDTQCRYRFASESAAKLFGLAQADFLGKTPRELGLPEVFVEPFIAQFQTVLATGQPVIGKSLFPGPNGVRWFEYVANPIVDAGGAVEAVVLSSRDNTETRQAVATMHRLAAIVESSSEAILSKTLEGVVTSWNSSAEKLYGYRADEIIGQSISLLYPPYLSQELWDILARVRAGETVKDLESMRVRKDGKLIEVWISISPIMDHNGYVIGASAIAHGITEHKRLIRELLNVNKELEEAKLVRDQFIGNMSHELRTPLASIIGFSELLLKVVPETGIDPQQNEDLHCILRNAYHLLDLVNDVLDLEKIEERHMKITPTLVEVKHLLSSIVAETRSIATEHNLLLKVEVEEGIEYIESDPMRLQQVLLNLVSNALKFTKQGEIIISARSVAPVEQPGGAIAISVKDSGIGISLDKQNMIFEAFYQVDGSYTREFGGTGLGLSIVSQLTRLLGGKVEVDSVPGVGSTFTVTLPITATRQPEAKLLPRLHPTSMTTLATAPLGADDDPSSSQRWLDEIRQEANTQQSTVVLVVDDDPDAIDLITEALRPTRLTVVGVQDPTQVLELVEQLHPCAITLDVMMPRLNGWQLLHQLKDNPSSADIPVVMISVLSEQTTGYVLGADAYILKPFKVGEVVSIFQRIIKPRHDVFPLQLPEFLTGIQDGDESTEDREEARI